MTDRSFLDLPFARGALDLAGELRTDDAFLKSALEEPSSRVLVVCGATKVPIDAEGGLEWQSLDGRVADELILLGRDESGRALFSIDVGDDEPPGLRFVAMRDVAESLRDLEANAAIAAIAIANWHRRHRFCAMCGAPTAPSEAGHVRHCGSCGADHYPRMDPAVIMLVTDGERCVLGRRAGAPEGRWSTLAGYVEPGESPEAAVVREVFEESGLSATEVTYRGSQPWPFPSSLMLAYEARAEHRPIVVSAEHQDVRWWTRDEIRDGLASGTLTIPPPISAGHHLIMSFIR